MIDEMVKGIRAMFAEYDSEVIERVSQSLFKMHNQVQRARDGNDFEVEHMGVAQWQTRMKLTTAVISTERFSTWPMIGG